MKLAVPTLYVDCTVAKPLTLGARTYKAGEMITLPFGRALFGKLLGAIGAIQNETQRAAEAAEMLAVYGGDAWFDSDAQTISRVADYLAQATVKTETKN